MTNEKVLPLRKHLPKARRYGLIALSGVAFVGAMFVQSTVAHAQVCEPFQATLQQERWPDNRNPISVFLKITTSGCATGTKASFTPWISLPIYTAPPDTPASSLARKCQLLVDQITARSPNAAVIVDPAHPRKRFEVTNADCGTGPVDQLTRFTVTDVDCAGQVPPAGGGLTIAIANTIDGLSNFRNGAIISDYEKDTVIPSCPAQGGNLVGLAGIGSGTSFVAGTPPQAEVALTLADGETIPMAEPIAAGTTPTALLAAFAVDLNVSLQAANKQERCQASGALLSCGSSSGLGLAPLLSGSAPTISFNTTDPAINKTTVAGTVTGVQEISKALTTGGCSNLLTNCGVLGPDVTVPPPPPPPAPSVPALSGWGVIGLGFLMIFVACFAVRRNGNSLG